jgi:hypothetical protein
MLQAKNISFPRFHASTPPCLFALLILALCTLNFELKAQYFSLGTDPASVKWNQVKTQHFRVIYPREMDSLAIHMANSLEYFRSPGSASLDANPGKWPVILHNRTIQSNATTPYAPKRIDMLTMTPQDNYGQDWLDQLVLHEFRHSVQYASINRGFTKALTVLMGQQAIPAVMGLFVPFWFIEGDAVATETATSKTGRGRVPSFEMKLRAQFLEKGIYSYDKAYNGSYKNFTSNWYELGYQIVGHTRVKYGPETWSKVMHRTGNIPVMLVPFSNTLYKVTGFGKSRLYDTITADLERSWLAEDEMLQLSPYEPVVEHHDKFYTNRTQPAVLEDGRIILRKSSMDDITRIVMVDSSGAETVIASPGYMPDECLSASSGKVCWAETDQDPRWALRSYSVIMLYDPESGKTRQVTHKTRYFAPALDREGQRIAAIEPAPSYNNFLVILDLDSGNILHRYPVPDNYFASYPAWSDDGNKIAVILGKSEGKALAVVDVGSGEFEILLPFSNTEISKPAFYQGYIAFTGAYTGKDNIFAIDTATRKLYQVTSARFGATDAAVSPDGKMLYYANYTSDGYQLVNKKMEHGTWNLELGTWKEWDLSENYKFPLADKLSEMENFTFNSEVVPDSAYEIKPYRKGLNLFNFHSWAPLAVDIDNTDAYPGITLLSQNLLGTSYTTLGYEYNMNEETGRYSLKYSFEGWYPAIDLETDYGLRRGNYHDSIYYDFDELNLGGWVRVPLNWYVRSWFVGLQPYAGYSYKYRAMNPGMEVKFTKDRFHSLNTKFYFYAQSRMSERDLNPRWGQSLDINFRQTLFEADTSSSIFAAELSLYFPGLLKHHSIRLYGGYQHRITEYYPYSDQIFFPRGYSHLFPGEMFSGSVNYEFPIFCPDWKIGPVLYLKRLKANLFYDQAIIFDKTPYQDYISTGLDLTFDFHLFRWFAPLEAGLRTIYFPQGQTVGFEFLYNVNLTY